MNEGLIVIISIVLSFLMGVVTLGFTAGFMTLQYFIVKFSRGGKVLVFVDTLTGRKIIVGKYGSGNNAGVISWKFRNVVYNSTPSKKCFGRFYAVDYIALNLECPFEPYDLTSSGEVPKTQIDMKTLNNLNERCLTAPQMDDLQGKMIKIAFFILLGVCAGIVMIYLKLIDISNLLEGLGVL